jgi:hypothetical protein
MTATDDLIAVFASSRYRQSNGRSADLPSRALLALRVFTAKEG